MHTEHIGQIFVLDVVDKSLYLEDSYGNASWDKSQLEGASLITVNDITYDGLMDCFIKYKGIKYTFIDYEAIGRSTTLWRITPELADQDMHGEFDVWRQEPMPFFAKEKEVHQVLVKQGGGGYCVNRKRFGSRKAGSLNKCCEVTG